LNAGLDSGSNKQEQEKETTDAAHQLLFASMNFFHLAIDDANNIRVRDIAFGLLIWLLRLLLVESHGGWRTVAVVVCPTLAAVKTQRRQRETKRERD
jgi:hypothetical protein